MRASSSWSRPTRRRCPAPTRSASPPCCWRPASSPMQEPETTADPGGAGRARRGRRRRAATARRSASAVRNVPSFADKLDAALEVEGFGTLTVDTAYGGDSFVIVDAARARLRDPPGRGARPRRNRRAHHRGRQRATRLRPSRKPGLGPHLVLPVRRAADARRTARWTGANAVAIRPGKVDRSPTGTGCSARMAVLHAKGRMSVGDRYRRPLDHRLDLPLPHRGARRRSAAARRSSRSSPARRGSPACTSTCWIRPIPIRTATGCPTHGRRDDRADHALQPLPTECLGSRLTLAMTGKRAIHPETY